MTKAAGEEGRRRQPKDDGNITINWWCISAMDWHH
jgi:hypothetical protein